MRYQASKGRFETIVVSDDPDFAQEEALPSIETELFEDKARSIITRNTSPDIGFDQSINAYRGCEMAASIATRVRHMPT